MPLTHDRELWACALEVERRHGPRAFLHASMEIDRLVAQDERAAAEVWREVLKRIELLEAEARSPAQ